MSEITSVYPPDDPAFEDHTLTAVTPESSGVWSIGLSSGWSFWVPADSPVAPAVGMAARLYGRGIGFAVRGLFLDGREVYYRTAAEQDAENKRLNIERDAERRYDFVRNRADYDRRYRALPGVFRSRIARFRRNNPDFRWQYEPYEMFACEQAVAIAEAFRDKADDPVACDAALADFGSLPWEAQKARVPVLDDGHSGNTFGCACMLARVYLTTPGLVPMLCGAMAPLVGCEAYGCVPEGAEVRS